MKHTDQRFRRRTAWGVAWIVLTSPMLAYVEGVLMRDASHEHDAIIEYGDCDDDECTEHPVSLWHRLAWAFFSFTLVLLARSMFADFFGFTIRGGLAGLGKDGREAIVNLQHGTCELTKGDGTVRILAFDVSRFGARKSIQVCDDWVSNGSVPVPFQVYE